jgi:hypothetical protein
MNLSDAAEYYVPFWVLLEYLDNSPNDPFVRVSILATRMLNSTNQSGFEQVKCCDIECLSGPDQRNSFVAYNIPFEYLIKPEELSKWSNNISKWFLEFAEKYSTNI